jgi:hypothetical protein
VFAGALRYAPSRYLRRVNQTMMIHRTDLISLTLNRRAKRFSRGLLAAARSLVPLQLLAHGHPSFEWIVALTIVPKPPSASHRASVERGSVEGDLLSRELVGRSYTSPSRPPARIGCERRCIAPVRGLHAGGPQAARRPLLACARGRVDYSAPSTVLASNAAGAAECRHPVVRTSRYGPDLYDMTQHFTTTLATAPRRCT